MENIGVLIRIRPINDLETQQKSSSIWEISTD